MKNNNIDINDEFELFVDEAYEILWKLYRPNGHKNGCDFNMTNEEKLHRILECIDHELGR